MATVAPRPRRRSPPAVAWILLLAVLVGVAAALLTRPVGSVSPGAPSLAGLTFQQLQDILVVTLCVGLGAWLYLAFRDSGARTPFPQRLVTTLLVALLLGVLVVGLLHLVHIVPISGSGNSTSPRGPGGGYPGNTSSPGPPTIFGPPGVTLPAWAGFAVILGIAVLAGILLVPYLVARAEERRRAREETEGPDHAAQQALREALQRLSAGDGTDARSAILALYARLLQLVGQRLGPLDSRTPREIEHDSVAVLGLRPTVAQNLTETFEEARYSTHPMTSEAVTRARTALADAIADLGSGPGASA